MKSASILVITNSPEKGKEISSKLKLLRECDTVQTVSYIEAISVLNTTQPSLILIYCSETDSVGIVKEIRTIKALDKVPILYISDTFEEEKLMYAFDNGIDDFFFLDNPDSLILMRIFLTIQKSVLYKKVDISNEILEAAGVIDSKTGIYLKEKAPIALRKFFSQSLEENLEGTVFMYIRPIAYEGKRLNMYSITSKIKTVPRGNDIVAIGKASGFYLILYNAGKKGAESITNRIQNILSDECKVYTCSAEIVSSFEEMEPVLYNSIKKQIEQDIEFEYLNNTVFDKTAKTLDIKDENGKKYKDFKKEFLSGFEKIVAPAFYRIQALSAEKFNSSEINYYINEKESKFYIKQGGVMSELIITYPAYMKVITDIKHHNDKELIKVKRLTFDFDDFSEEKVNLLLDDMLNEYSNELSLKMMNTPE